MMQQRPLAIVTGASSGFGWSISEQLVANGWQVLALARRQQRLESLQQRLGEKNCLIRPFDVCDKDAIEALVAWLKQQSLVPQILVNNAGLALGLSPAWQAELSDWETMIATNNLALVRMTRAILPMMVEANRGHIVNIGSIAGTYPYPGGNVYGATKAFVEQFSLNLRADLIGKAVRVTNIEPGLAHTEFSQVRFHGDKEKADSVYQGVEPLLADDIARAVVFCVSQPAHVNINRLEVMPTCQASAPLAVKQPQRDS